MLYFGACLRFASPGPARRSPANDKGGVSSKEFYLLLKESGVSDKCINNVISKELGARELQALWDGQVICLFFFERILLF